MVRASIPSNGLSALQPSSGFSSAELAGSILGGFLVTVLVTLVVGGLVLGLGGRWSERQVDRIRSDAGRCFVYGLVTVIASIVVILLLAVTGIGLIVAIPLGIGLAILDVVGYGLAVVAFGAFVGRSWDRPWRGLLVAAPVLGVVYLVPVVGGLVNFVVGTIGFGAIVQGYLDDGRSGGRDAAGRVSGQRSNAEH